MSSIQCHDTPSSQSIGYRPGVSNSTYMGAAGGRVWVRLGPIKYSTKKRSTIYHIKVNDRAIIRSRWLSNRGQGWKPGHFSVLWFCRDSRHATQNWDCPGKTGTSGYPITSDKKALQVTQQICVFDNNAWAALTLNFDVKQGATKYHPEGLNWPPGFLRV